MMDFSTYSGFTSDLVPGIFGISCKINCLLTKHNCIHKPVRAVNLNKELYYHLKCVLQRISGCPFVVSYEQ